MRPSVAETVRFYRKKNGFTLREVASLAGVNHSTVCRVESGAAPSACVLARIAGALRLTDEELVELFRSSAAE